MHDTFCTVRVHRCMTLCKQESHDTESTLRAILGDDVMNLVKICLFVRKSSPGVNCMVLFAVCNVCIQRQVPVRLPTCMIKSDMHYFI